MSYKHHHIFKLDCLYLKRHILKSYKPFKQAPNSHRQKRGQPKPPRGRRSATVAPTLRMNTTWRTRSSQQTALMITNPKPTPAPRATTTRRRMRSRRTPRGRTEGCWGRPRSLQERCNFSSGPNAILWWMLEIQ